VLEITQHSFAVTHISSSKTLLYCHISAIWTRT